MISSLYNGISGLDAFQKALDVESNNIANVNTVGFKSDRITFADLMYQDRIGKGVTTQSIYKDFTTGNFMQTGNDYDVAINGNGFFIVEDPKTGEVFYTKAGNLKQDVDGNLVTAGGYYVQGANATITGEMIDNDLYTQFIASSVIISDTSVDTINSKATDYAKSAQADIDPITGRVIKTTGSKIENIESLKEDYNNKLNAYAANQVAGTASTNQVTIASFNDFATQLIDAEDIVSIKVGNTEFSQAFTEDAATTMQLLAEKIASSQGIRDATFDEATGNLTINTVVPGENLTIANAAINQTPYGIATTNAISGSGLADVQASFIALEDALTRAGAEITQVTTSVSTVIQPNQALNIGTLGDLQLNLTNLGISDNQFSNPEIIDGIIYMVQGDNRYAVGRIQTAGFADELSLSPQGGNLFSATTNSGEALDATLNSKIVGKTLELSNSELSEGLVNLIVFQRAYEANSKSITTSDEFLNIAIQLKR